MSDIINFTFSENNSNVRILLVKNEPHFALQDICTILNLNNVTRLRERLDQKGVHLKSTPTKGGEQMMYYISEKNLYKCIFKSKKKEAEKFQDWIFETVLPNIRKNGYFSLTENSYPLSEYIKRNVQVQKSKEINALQFALGGVVAIKKYNSENCEFVTGMTTKQVKGIGERVGLKSAQRNSAKETLRNIPELQSKACVMALNDEIVKNNPQIKLQQLRNLDKNAEKTFQSMLELGIKPAELNN